MKYEEWIREFIKGKKELPAPEASDKFAVHTTRRYVDYSGDLWETAITYTGRLVVRWGRIALDGVSVAWGEWITQHDVVVPEKSPEASPFPATTPVKLSPKR